MQGPKRHAKRPPKPPKSLPQKPLPLVTVKSLRELSHALSNAINLAYRSGHTDLAIGLTETREWVGEEVGKIMSEHRQDTLARAAEQARRAADEQAQKELDAATARRGGVARELKPDAFYWNHPATSEQARGPAAAGDSD